MRYKKSKLFLKPNAPLWGKDLIARQAIWEDEKETISLVVNKPLKFKAPYEGEHINWKILFLTCVKQFNL